MKIASLKQKSAIIVIHESSGGPGHDLKNFLLVNNTRELLLISHPLLYFKEGFKKSSRFELYKNGKLIKEDESFHWDLPEPLLYVKDFIYTFIWTFKYCKNPDLFFGVDNLNALTGLYIRLLFKKTKVIYYVIDYVPMRFKNKLLNNIYHFIEKISAQHSNTTWNLSPRMIEGREEKWKRPFPNQIVVPYGIYFERIKRAPFNKINKHEIIFMGALLGKQGVQLVISALPLIIKKIPDVKFTIIGKGPYENNLKKLVIKFRLGNHVSFLGHIESHEEMENRIAKAAIATALYDPKNADFSYYADPGKIKNYLGAGVPVIMTDVPQIAGEIESNECGIVVEYDIKKLANKLINFLENKSETERYRVNAIKFAEKYSWDKVFNRAIKYV